LDIFSGSGCLGLAVLKNIKRARVDFVELSGAFVKQIKLNLKINKINPGRYRVIRSDMFQNVRGKYDCILANPPYLSPQRKRTIQKSVLDFEPKEALFAGQDGLSHIRKFINQAGGYLAPGGRIYMEFGLGQKRGIEKILKGQSRLRFSFFKDQYGKWRYLTMRF
jgi:release factor glutamine methyltransferase